MPVLVHGTALAVGTYGVILIGPSGSGKSSMALRLIDQARRAGHFATLLSDDQVFLETINGRVIATAPPTIKGLIEVRGSGIGRMEPIEDLVVHQALSLVIPDASTRIPEENQTWSPHESISVPLLFIDRSTVDPFFRLSVLISGFPVR